MFHRYGFQTLVYLIKTCLTLARIFVVLFVLYSQALCSHQTTVGDEIYCLLLNQPRRASSDLGSQWASSRCSFLESSVTARVPTLLLHNVGEQTVLPQVLTPCLSQWDSESLEFSSSTPQKTPAKHQSCRSWQTASHLAVTLFKSPSVHLPFTILSQKTTLFHSYPASFASHHLRPLGLLEKALDTWTAEFPSGLQQLCHAIILRDEYFLLWHLQDLIAWHAASDITVCCYGKCLQFSRMTYLPEGEDA